MSILRWRPDVSYFGPDAPPKGRYILYDYIEDYLPDIGKEELDKVTIRLLEPEK